MADSQKRSRAWPQPLLRSVTLTLTAALILCIAGWSWTNGMSVGRVVFVVAATAPLWIPLHRLAKGERRTFAWMTLAVVPYIVFAIMESIANPPARVWAICSAVVAFTLFAALIAYVRVTGRAQRL